MFRVGLKIAGVALAAWLGASSTHAQTVAPRLQCLNSRPDADADALITACTAALARGRIGDLGDVAYAYVIRGTAYRRKGDNDAAIRDFDAALRIAPRFVYALANRGLAYLDRGDAPRALSDLNAALQFNRTDPEIFAARAHAYANMGELSRAVADYDRAGALNRNNASYQNYRCWLRGLANIELDTARAACDAALILAPNSSAFLDSRGLIGLRQQRWQDAWNDYDAAARVLQNCASCLFGRGVAAARLGRTADSQADLASALAIDPHVADFYAGYGLTR